MSGRQTLGAALSLALVLGCSQPGGEGDNRPDEAPAPPQQSWALGDGAVTRQEYETAIHTFLACVRDAGYRVGNLQLSPADGLTLVYDITPSGEPDIYNEVVQGCNLTFLSDIEPGYVESHPQVMDAGLQQAVAGCLRVKGIQLTGHEQNLPEFLVTADRDGSVVDCTVYEMHRLFPELPDYGLAPLRWRGSLGREGTK